VKEGIYLFQNGLDPYSGGIFRHVGFLQAVEIFANSVMVPLKSPLYLSLFSTIFSHSSVPSAIIWTLSDALGAWALTQIWYARQGVKRSQRDVLVVMAYVLSPLLVMVNP
jgi:GPI-anchor transamidase subunit U